MIGSNFRTPDAVRHYLSESCRALVSKLTGLGEEYFAESTTVNTAASTATTALPSAAWKLLRLRTTIDGKRVALTKASVDEVDSEVTYEGWATGTKPKYRLRGQSLVWYPVPIAIHVVTVVYVPTAIFRDASGNAVTELTSEHDTFDGVFGWELWPVLSAAIKLKSDAGKDTAELRAEIATLEGDMLRAAAGRSDDAPPKIRDTYGGDDCEDA